MEKRVMGDDDLEQRARDACEAQREQREAAAADWQIMSDASEDAFDAEYEAYHLGLLDPVD